MGKRSVEITAFGYRRIIVLKKWSNVEREQVKHSSCEETAVPIEAVGSPLMQQLIESLVEGSPNNARAAERLGRSRTSLFSKLRRFVFR